MEKSRVRIVVEALSDAAIDRTTWYASHERLPGLVARVAEGATRDAFTVEENILLQSLYITTIRRIENVFVQVEEGLISREAFERFRPSEDFFNRPYFRDFWSSGSVRFEPRFRSFFEANFLPPEGGAP